MNLKTTKKKEIIVDDFLVKISEDEMLAYIEIFSLTQDLEEKLKLNWENFKKELEKVGLKGVLSQPEVEIDKIIVARGIPPKEGSPERIELLEKFLKECALEDGLTKDLREISKIICVEKDEVIGKRIPPVPGIPGVNIWGELLELPSLSTFENYQLGSNLYIEDSSNLIKAKESGVLICSKNQIEVFPEFNIKGDIDFSIGNINFIGKKLTIEGDIKFGFKVKCKGNLELKGCTENKVYIEVEGNFTCSGIIRGEETKVKVKGFAQINGVEYAFLEVDGDLEIKNYLIFAEVIVTGSLKCKDGKGIIYGGNVKVFKNIEVKTLGHPAQTLTKVLAGYPLELIELYSKLKQEKVILNEVIEKISYGIMLGERLQREKKLTPEKEKVWIDLQEEFERKLNELEELEGKIRELEEKMECYRKQFIKILDKVYPGVILGITDLTYTIAEEKKGPLIYYLEGDFIKEAPAKEKEVKRIK